MPATSYRTVLESRDALEPCSSYDLADVVDVTAGTATRACRVELPVGNGSETRPCATSFAYVDEFFASTGTQEQSVDVSVLGEQGVASYTFASPLCVEDVRLTAVALGGLADRASGREIALDASEAMLLSPPTARDGPEVYGAACVDDANALFVEDDRVNASFKLVETRVVGHHLSREAPRISTS